MDERESQVRISSYFIKFITSYFSHLIDMFIYWFMLQSMYCKSMQTRKYPYTQGRKKEGEAVGNSVYPAHHRSLPLLILRRYLLGSPRAARTLLMFCQQCTYVGGLCIQLLSSCMDCSCMHACGCLSVCWSKRSRRKFSWCAQHSSGIYCVFVHILMQPHG